MNGKRDEFGNDKQPRWLSFRFSVWDIIFLTSFVAILFALPQIVLAALVLASLFGMMMLGMFLLDHFGRGPSRSWTGMKASSEAVIRGFVYCGITFVVGAISLISKVVSW